MTGLVTYLTENCCRASGSDACGPACAPTARAILAAQEDKDMKRFHVHLGVPDLSESIRFYSNLFGMPPAVEKPDYAKWMLDDPRVNFAISKRGARTGPEPSGVAGRIR